ncbi:MAG: glycosyltransferase [Bacteroidota bacterium]
MSRNQLKVLHVMPSLSRAFGGPTQSWVGYARAAKTSGMAVSVAAPAVNEADREWLQAQTDAVSYSFFPSAGKGAMVFSPALHRWLVRHGKAYDAVHVHGLFNPISSIALRQCVRRNWPVVLRPFGTLSRYTFTHRRTWIKRQYFRRLDGPSLQKAPAIHFTTRAECDEAAWHGIDFSGRSHVVPPPLAELPAPSATIADRDAPIVLFLSRIHPKKNIECLIDAWPRVVAGMPRAELVIAGSGDPDYVEALRTRAQTLGVGEISFPGFVAGEKKAGLLAKSSLFVLPSFQENFGVAVMEAIGAGLPVVISEQVQLADFVSKNDLGHVIKPEPEALAFSILEILGSKAYQDHCSTQGPAAIRQDFSLQQVGKQLVSMYESVRN